MDVDDLIVHDDDGIVQDGIDDLDLLKHWKPPFGFVREWRHV